MSKKLRIQDTPEFKYFEEHQDEILKEIEEDEKVKDLEIPEEWDIAFRQTIQNTFEEKKNRRKKRLRKILIVAASFVIVAGFGVNYTLVRVEGVGLADLFQKMISDDGNNYLIYSTDNEDYEMLPDEDDEEIYFEGTTLEQVFKEAREEIKRPMFHLDNVLKDFKISSAKYNKMYHVFNIELSNGEKYLYISQEEIEDEGSSGVIMEEDLLDNVRNHNLNQDISIYQGIQHDILLFSIKKGNCIFTLNGEISLEECKKFAENLSFE